MGYNTNNDHAASSRQSFRDLAAMTIDTSIKRDWYLTNEERAMLDKWYVLHWTGQFFAGKIVPVGRPPYFDVVSKRTFHFKPLCYTILHDGITYQICYHHSYKSTCQAAPKVVLSFRRKAGAITGYVLVRPVWKTRG